MTEPTIDFRAVFEAIPGNFVVVQPNSPHFTILAISDGQLQINNLERENAVGKGLFEIYPENPEAITATGPSAMRISLENVVKYKKPDQLPQIRYDVPNEDGIFEELYWTALNKPVFNKEGEIIYIIHSNQNVTEQVLAVKGQRALQKIEQNYSMLMQAPVAVTIVTGPENFVELANNEILQLLGRTSEMIGKPLFESVPELKQQGIAELFDQVRKTGEAVHFHDCKTILVKNGKEETHYFNFVHQPYFQLPEDKLPQGVICVVHDVTEQVEARKSMEESEYRFRNLIKEAPVPTGIYVGQEMKIAYANNAMIKIMGKDTSIIGKNFKEALPEMIGQPFLELMDKVFTTGETYHAKEDKAEIMVDGKLNTIYTNFFYKALRDTHGVIYGILNMAVDVTDQVLARKQTEENEQQIRSIIESVSYPLGVYIGKEMRIQFANQALKDILGKGNDIIGRPYQELLPELENQEVFEQLEQVFTTGIPFHTKYHQLVLNIDGNPQTFYFNYSLNPLYNAKGEIYGIINTGADVTELVLAQQRIEKYAEDLKESEERFRIMADAAPNIVWALNPDGTIKYMNKFGLEYMGTQYEAFIEEGWSPYVHPQDLPNTQAKIGQAITNSELFSVEMRLLGKDGQYRWFLSRGLPSYYPNGMLYGYIGSAIDISDLKQATDSLEVKNKQLQRINNDLDNFIYTASHDLKAPISNVEGLLNALRRVLPPEILAVERVSRFLEMMQLSVERFKKTIGSLTDVVRLQKENSQEAAMVDLLEKIREVELDLEPMIQATNARIDVDVSSCSSIKFSEKNLRSVVYNLLSNAIKYHAPDRPPKVRVRCECIKNFNVLIVEDNGLGLGPRPLSQLFTMFKRFHVHVEGTGIGLYMVKKMVENAGGHIEVESKEGVGSIFRVYFPRNEKC